MDYKIDWVRAVLPDSPPPPKRSVVQLDDVISIKDDATKDLAEVEFTDVTVKDAPEKIVGCVARKEGRYHGEFPHSEGDIYTFTAYVINGVAYGMLFRRGPAEDSGGHWGGR